MSREEIIEKLSRLKPELRKRYPVKNLALFGSYARGDNHDSSDIDIMVEFDGPIGWEFVDLIEEIEREFPENKIDVISRGGIRPKLWPYIKSDLLYV